MLITLKPNLTTKTQKKFMFLKSKDIHFLIPHTMSNISDILEKLFCLISKEIINSHYIHHKIGILTSDWLVSWLLSNM
jgi:hypothetical protein